MNNARKKFKCSDKILDELKIVLKVHNDIELSRAINVAASTISSWRTRKYIDLSKILPVLAQNNIDLNLFLYESEETEISDYSIQANEFSYENAILKAELKKIDAEIGEEHKEVGKLRSEIYQESSQLPTDTIEIINKLQSENKLLLELVNKLSAKLI